MTARVTPGNIPAPRGGVWILPALIQNKLLLAPSTTQPSVFSSSASFARAASASARATICASLLQVLNFASGSLAGSRTLEVRRCQPGASSGGAAVGCNDIASVGESAPRGEYPRGPTPR